MRSRAEPIYFMRFCKATPEMERRMNEWMLDYHEEAFEFYVAGPGEINEAGGAVPQQARGPIRRILKR